MPGKMVILTLESPVCLFFDTKSYDKHLDSGINRYDGCANLARPNTQIFGQELFQMLL